MTEESVNSFRDLRVWQDGIRLVTECYRVTRTFPDDERFGLVNQLRRSAVSVPANIAEGWGRQSTKDYLRYLAIANGSLAELETHLEIAAALGFLSQEAHATLTDDIHRLARMLNRLKQSLRQRPNS